MLTATYSDFPPHPALRDSISHYWSLTTGPPRSGFNRAGTAGEGGGRRLVVPLDSPLFCALFPNADQGLAFNLVDERPADGALGEGLSPATGVVIGAMTEPVPMRLREGAALLGVTFRVGRGAGFLREAAGRITDRFTSLTDVWGPSSASLAEQLADRSTWRERIRDLDRALLRRRPSRPNHTAVDRAVSLIGRCRGAVSIAVLSERIGVSRQRLARLFRNEVGVAPKFLCRVARFQALLTRVRSRTDGWAALAAELGYYDQAHLIQEFRQFTGQTPGRFVAGG